MLVIRTKQMAALNRQAAQQFRDDSAAFLRAEAPEVFADADAHELDAFIRHGLDRAGAHGIADRHYAQQYLLFMAWVGPDFDSVESWAQAILSAPASTEEEKIARLEDHILGAWEGNTSCL